MPTTPSSEIAQPVARFGQWHLRGLVGLWAAGQVIRSTQIVLAEGGATPTGTTLRIVLGVVAVALLATTRTSVRLDEDGIRLRPWLLPLSPCPWAQVTSLRLARIEQPTFVDAVRYLSLGDTWVLAVTRGGRTSRVRVPRRALRLVRDYAEAFSVSNPASS